MLQAIRPEVRRRRHLRGARDERGLGSPSIASPLLLEHDARPGPPRTGHGDVTERRVRAICRRVLVCLVFRSMVDVCEPGFPELDSRGTIFRLGPFAVATPLFPCE